MRDIRLSYEYPRIIKYLGMRSVLYTENRSLGLILRTDCCLIPGVFSVISALILTLFLGLIIIQFTQMLLSQLNPDCSRILRLKGL